MKGKYVEKRAPGPYGRDHLESYSDFDPKNAWGTLMHVGEDGRELDVVCLHGGSMWLCIECKESILTDQGVCASGDADRLSTD